MKIYPYGILAMSFHILLIHHLIHLTFHQSVPLISGDVWDPQPAGPCQRREPLRVQVAARGQELRALLSSGDNHNSAKLKIFWLAIIYTPGSLWRKINDVINGYSLLLWRGICVYAYRRALYRLLSSIVHPFFLSVPFDKTVLGSWARHTCQVALVISVCKEFFFFQEQVTELLQVKSFKRKYPDCPRRFGIHYFFRCWASL